MPYRRKDSPVWWVSITGPDGKRARRSTGTTDRKEAEALEAKWKLEAYQSRFWDEQPEVMFEEVLLAYLKARTGTPSERDYRLHGRRLRESFAGVMMNGFSAQHVRSHIRRRQADGVSNATINRELAVLSASINLYNLELEMTLPNPVAGRRLKEPEGRLRWLTRSEAQALIIAAGQQASAVHLPPLIRLALNTGMRRGELLGLEWRRVDLKEGLIFLEGHHTKSGKRRTVPINRNAREAILTRARFRAEHCPGSPWVFANAKGERIKEVKRSFMRACKVVGIEDFRFHDLRHTCAAWLVTEGVPLTEVRDLLGHSTIKMTERYAHLAPENVRAAVALLETVESRLGHVK
jgi:integrase